MVGGHGKQRTLVEKPNREKVQQRPSLETGALGPSRWALGVPFVGGIKVVDILFMTEFGGEDLVGFISGHVRSHECELAMC